MQINLSSKYYTYHFVSLILGNLTFIFILFKAIELTKINYLTLNTVLAFNFIRQNYPIISFNILYEKRSKSYFFKNKSKLACLLKSTIKNTSYWI